MRVNLSEYDSSYSSLSYREEYLSRKPSPPTYTPSDLHDISPPEPSSEPTISTLSSSLDLANPQVYKKLRFSIGILLGDAIQD